MRLRLPCGSIRVALLGEVRRRHWATRGLTSVDLPPCSLVEFELARLGQGNSCLCELCEQLFESRGFLFAVAGISLGPGHHRLQDNPDEVVAFLRASREEFLPLLAQRLVGVGAYGQFLQFAEEGMSGHDPEERGRELALVGEFLEHLLEGRGTNMV